MSNEVKFSHGKDMNLNNVTISDGTFYVTEENGKLFLGHNGKLLPLLQSDLNQDQTFMEWFEWPIVNATATLVIGNTILESHSLTPTLKRGEIYLDEYAGNQPTWYFEDDPDNYFVEYEHGAVRICPVDGAPELSDGMTFTVGSKYYYVPYQTDDVIGCGFCLIHVHDDGSKDYYMVGGYPQGVSFTWGESLTSVEFGSYSINCDSSEYPFWGISMDSNDCSLDQEDDITAVAGDNNDVTTAINSDHCCYGYLYSTKWQDNSSELPSTELQVYSADGTLLTTLVDTQTSPTLSLYDPDGHGNTGIRFGNAESGHLAGGAGEIWFEGFSEEMDGTVDFTTKDYSTGTTYVVYVYTNQDLQESNFTIVNIAGHVLTTTSSNPTLSFDSGSGMFYLTGNDGYNPSYTYCMTAKAIPLLGAPDLSEGVTALTPGETYYYTYWYDDGIASSAFMIIQKGNISFERSVAGTFAIEWTSANTVRIGGASSDTSNEYTCDGSFLGLSVADDNDVTSDGDIPYGTDTTIQVYSGVPDYFVYYLYEAVAPQTTEITLHVGNPTYSIYYVNSSGEEEEITEAEVTISTNEDIEISTSSPVVYTINNNTSNYIIPEEVYDSNNGSIDFTIPYNEDITKISFTEAVVAKASPYYSCDMCGAEVLDGECLDCGATVYSQGGYYIDHNTMPVCGIHIMALEPTYCEGCDKVVVPSPQSIEIYKYEFTESGIDSYNLNKTSYSGDPVVWRDYALENGYNIEYSDTGTPQYIYYELADQKFYITDNGVKVDALSQVEPDHRYDSGPVLTPVVSLGSDTCPASKDDTMKVTIEIPDSFTIDGSTSGMEVLEWFNTTTGESGMVTDYGTGISSIGGIKTSHTPTSSGIYEYRYSASIHVYDPTDSTKYCTIVPSNNIIEAARVEVLIVNQDTENMLDVLSDKGIVASGNFLETQESKFNFVSNPWMLTMSEAHPNSDAPNYMHKDYYISHCMYNIDVPNAPTEELYYTGQNYGSGGWIAADTSSQPGFTWYRCLIDGLIVDGSSIGYSTKYQTSDTTDPPNDSSDYTEDTDSTTFTGSSYKSFSIARVVPAGEGIITFTVCGTTYKANEGETWGDWINRTSPNNITNSIYIYYENNSLFDSNGNEVMCDNIIEPSGVYTIENN